MDRMARNGSRNAGIVAAVSLRALRNAEGSGPLLQCGTTTQTNEEKDRAILANDGHGLRGAKLQRGSKSETSVRLKAWGPGATNGG